MSSFNTGFIEMFKEYGIRYPIVKAPMARIDDIKLASEVYLAGGLSFFSTGYKSYEDLEKDLESAHEVLKTHINTTNGLLPIGIAFMTFSLDSQFSSLPSPSKSLLHLTLSYKPLAVWFSFGDFSKYVPIVRSLSPHTKIFAQVQTIEQAVHAYKNNADVIVVQGNESGGHGLANGASTLTLVPEAIDTLNQIYTSSKEEENLKKPIILAAGGVMDGRGLASILVLGGDGVVMGTRFIVCKESAAHPDAKKIILNTNDGGMNTVRTQVFDKLRERNVWSSQWDGRAIKNKTVEENEELDDEKLDERKRIYNEAVLGKDYSRTVIYAGAGVGLIHNEPSVKEILESTAKLAIDTIEHMYNSTIIK